MFNVILSATTSIMTLMRSAIMTQPNPIPYNHALSNLPTSKQGYLPTSLASSAYHPEASPRQCIAEVEARSLRVELNGTH